MQPSNRLHHLSWVVADLDATLAGLEPWICPEEIIHEELPTRGVRTARIPLGDAWIVFVQPTGPGIPATRLATAGEGLLLLSLGVSSLESGLSALAERGIGTAGVARAGLSDWRVVDVDATLPGGVTLQLCETPDA